jgi:hypothetical protein
MDQTQKKFSLRAGLLGIGLDTYWPQFDGLLYRLNVYQRQMTVRPLKSTENELDWMKGLIEHRPCNLLKQSNYQIK